MNPSLLIVDDEELSRIALRKMALSINPDFSEIFETGIGTAIMDLVRRHRPDIIFMDIRLPGINGLDAAAQIQVATPESRIIVVTAYDHFSLAQRAVNLNLDGYLLKPVMETELRRVLGAALARWRSRQNRPAPAEAQLKELLPGTSRIQAENRLIRDFLVGGRLSSQDLVRFLGELWGGSVSWGDALAFALALEREADSQGMATTGPEAAYAAHAAAQTAGESAEEWLLQRLITHGAELMHDEDMASRIRRYLASTDIAVICLEHLADHLRLSPAYTSRLFKDAMGTNFASYLSELRIERAIELIREHPELTVDEVGRRLGYNDPVYFNKLFRQSTGRTLKEFARHTSG